MRNKLLLISVALLASVCLWLYVVTVINPEGSETISGIPVTFIGEEDIRADLGFIITEGSNQTVDLKVSGRRTMIQKLNNENVTVRVDVSRIKKIDEYKMNYEIVFPSDITSADVSVTDRSQNQISFTVEKLAKKNVEVKGVLDGDVAEGYMQEKMSFDFDEILIEGPEAVVGKVRYAQVILSRTNLDKTVTASVPYTLIDEDGNPVDSADITADVEEIKVTLPVVKFKEVPLMVEFIAGGGATKDDVVYEVSPQTITVSGDAAVLDGLNQISLGNVDLSDISDPNGEAPLEMAITLPDGLKNVSGDELASVTIKIVGLDNKIIRASSMEFTHIPQGFTPTSMTQMLQINVRAPSSEIGKISADNLRVVADLAEYTKEGTYVVPVTVLIDDFSKAGAVGDYTIVVMLSKE